MTHQIINAAFKKAESETEKDSINANAEFLSEYIFEKFRYSISTKSLTRYYKGESSPNQKVKDYLAQYLGYESYDIYIQWNSTSNQMDELEEKKKIHLFSNKKLIVALSFLMVVATSSYLGYISGKEECMIWNNDHYIKTECSGRSEEQKFIPNTYNNLKKVEVSETTTFFKNGEVRIWYYKSNGELEYFSSPGKHPVSGKTLKPITKYMIDKYVKN
ncbi:hypothetical protein [Christiangramia sediminis]|uniref:Uncharacterized protein n=1 Tax=Christiangramia sediminis TaxID=2881336 RepID=A0A9X1LJP3_9FLAO|nr:hypothetical protein [Christiangramia sediminis]MCB7481631.1 hypothetical protein [Christiangramia sediminis]